MFANMIAQQRSYILENHFCNKCVVVSGQHELLKDLSKACKRRLNKIGCLPGVLKACTRRLNKIERLSSALKTSFKSSR